MQGLLANDSLPFKRVYPGELNTKTRTATVKALTRTHMMVLSRKDFYKALNIIERREQNDKVNFI